jgi:threonine/homoserine/homoserine lactone efflux protein
MPDLAHLLAFLAAALLLTVAPGPDNLMVLSLGMSRGPRAGVAFGLGCALGCLSHTALAALGVSTLLAGSPVAFGVLKVAGGLYLVWLGVQAVRHAGVARVAGVADATDVGANAGVVPVRALFARGWVANAINPKVVLFFLSFLPQFVQPGRGPLAWQLALLGAVFTVQAALVFGLLGLCSGSVGAWLNQRPRVGPWLDRAAGGVFVGLGWRMMVGR